MIMRNMCRKYVLFVQFVFSIGAILCLSESYTSKTRLTEASNVIEGLESEENKISRFKSDADKLMDGTIESLPVDIQVEGNPGEDRQLLMKLDTPSRTFNFSLDLIDNSVFHEDLKILDVFTDSSGRTVFQENSRNSTIHAKASEYKYYHDHKSGSFLSIRENGFSSNGEPVHHVEGFLYGELVIAPPTQASSRRHRRSLSETQHTIWWDKEPLAFQDDELFVPESVDMLKMLPKYHTPLRKKRQLNRRVLRQSPRVQTRIEPELLLFVDHAMVEQFGGKTEELLEYLLHFWHSVNWKFLTISLQRQLPFIDLKIREIGVFRDHNAQPFIEENLIRRGSRLFSLYDAMDSLQRWLVRYENVLPEHDITFLQTGYDACRMSGQTRRFQDTGFTLENDETDNDEVEGCVAGTAVRCCFDWSGGKHREKITLHELVTVKLLVDGVAYVRGACLSAPYFPGISYNFGIGEASTSFNGVIIAAHEIGHLLGAYHDGESEASSCSTNSGFIMSYTREDAYKFSRFSDCSISSFQSFLRMDRSGCLRARSSSNHMKFPTTFPGAYMSITEQCRRFTGGPPCQIGPKQCEHLCCDDAKGQWRYTRSEPAVDGTSCGPRSICLNGQCLPINSFGK